MLVSIKNAKTVSRNSPHTLCNWVYGGRLKSNAVVVKTSLHKACKYRLWCVLHDCYLLPYMVFLILCDVICFSK